MKRILLTVLILTSNAFARDCDKELFSYTAGIYLYRQINAVADEHIHTGKQIKELCNKRVLIGMWNIDSRDFIKSYEAKNKEGERACVQLDSEISKETNCYVPEPVLRGLSHSEYTSQSFNTVCEELVPGMIERFHSCRSK